MKTEQQWRAEFSAKTKTDLNNAYTALIAVMKSRNLPINTSFSDIDETRSELRKIYEGTAKLLNSKVPYAIFCRSPYYQNAENSTRNFLATVKRFFTPLNSIEKIEADNLALKTVIDYMVSAGAPKEKITVFQVMANLHNLEKALKYEFKDLFLSNQLHQLIRIRQPVEQYYKPETQK